MNDALSSPPNHRILIVEDEEGLVIHMTFLLKRMNCVALDAVAYGEQAVERAGECHPDLILMDISLAGQMDGIEAAQLIRERYNIPVIFLTALSQNETIHSAQGTQPYAYLVKPVKEADLRAAIEIAIYKHQMEARLMESEQRYRLLFEKMGSGSALSEVICDAAGQPMDSRFLAINPAFAAMTGTRPENLVGRTRREAWPDFAGEQLHILLDRVALKGENIHFEYFLPNLNRYLNVSAYSPKHGQFAMVVEDITERRRAELALRESEENLRASYSRQEQNLRRMNILRNIDQAITTHTDYSNMAEAILSDIASPGEVDAAVLFVPNPPSSGRVRGTGPLGVLRLAGSAGLPETVIDSALFNWLTQMANQVYHNCLPIYITDMLQETPPGAEALNRVAGFQICAALPLVARRQVKGVLLFFIRHNASVDNDWKPFLQSLALQTAIGMDHVDMLEHLKRSHRELALAYDETIKGWAQALELREKEDRGHAERVSGLTVRLASQLGINGEALDHIRRGAFLHDIGKMAVPDNIVYKTGPLNSEEWGIMRQHPYEGFRMLSGISYLEKALDVVYCHHEKWDGSGYPRGLKGDGIPLMARIFAVVDVWDALTNNRPYRTAWTNEEVRAYMGDQSAKQFDPHVLEVFLQMV
jgi:putative nucleotidyltransferase with HDIG domain/PAS domain S-box-containing protein